MTMTTSQFTTIGENLSYGLGFYTTILILIALLIHQIFFNIKFEKLKLKLEAAAKADYAKAITFEFSPVSTFPMALSKATIFALISLAWFFKSANSCFLSTDLLHAATNKIPLRRMNKFFMSVC